MSGTRMVRFSRGDILFREGDSGREMYIIQAGKIGIYKRRDNRSVPVAMLEKGNFVGEMSFISGLERSATALAEEDVIANRIDTDILESDHLSLNGWEVNIARVIADRIRRTTDLFIGEYSPDHGGEIMPRLQEKTDQELHLVPKLTNSHGILYLKGTLHRGHLEDIKEEIRTLAVGGCEDVVLDFSEVPDIDNSIIDFLSGLAQKNLFFLQTQVRVKNVQLIRSKLLSIKGIRELIAETRLPARRITQGDYLIRQGDSDQNMYVVKTGSFTIFREVEGKEVILGKAETDDVVGEMKLIAGGERSASVRADQSSSVYCIDIDEFYKNSYQIPAWFMALIRSLVVRLRKTNEMLEMAVRRQLRDDVPNSVSGSDGTALLLQFSSAYPGLLSLEGGLLRETREYFISMVNMLLKRRRIDLVLDMRKIEMIDHDSIRYLLKLYVYLQKKGGTLQILGPHKDIFHLFKQYGIELE